MVSIGADLGPGTLLTAYRSGLFPMPVRSTGLMGWWSPDPRGVLHPQDLVVGRSLRRSRHRYEIRVNTDFEGVVAGCSDSSRPHCWINDQIVAAYTELHRLGWAHSVEAWDEEGLAGGLYGVAVGSLFAGESMFHRRTDASKVALTSLAALYNDRADRLIDVQWRTNHLASLGATEMGRRQYLDLLSSLVATDGPDWPTSDQTGGQEREGH